MKKVSVSLRTKLTLLKRQKGVCNICKDSIKTGKNNIIYAQTDHVIPKSFNGNDKITNLQLICLPCHYEKTSFENSIRGEIKTIQEYLISSSMQEFTFTKAKKCSSCEAKARKMYYDVYTDKYFCKKKNGACVRIEELLKFSTNKLKKNDKKNVFIKECEKISKNYKVSKVN